MRTLLRYYALPLVLSLHQPALAGLPEGYASLYLSPHASPGVRAAAGDLADFMERTFGQRPDVRREPLFRMGMGIRIGPSPGHPAFDTDPLTDQILVERGSRGLEIHGADNPSTVFAVYRFIEEGLGWRYYQPDPGGLERLDSPPDPPASKGPGETILLETAGFHSRNPYPSIGRSGKAVDWANWHGVRERFVYNHSLHGIITPEEFGEHPDWFAKDENGEPMDPPFPHAHGYNDHPDLTHTEVRQRVIERTIEALRKALASGKPSFREKGYPPVRILPGMVSTSLSLGDSYIFGHFPDSYQWAPGEYFRRWPDWSNHVFAYTNAIAGTILDAWEHGLRPSPEKPDLFLGALSYLNWEDVPDFPVHSSIVPYLTFDRSQWYDPAARADDLELVGKWATKGTKVLGTWDYLFGYGFLMPRSLSHIVSESIPALHKRGVRAYFCQVASLWPFDSHTSWLATRLLWNPEADAEALLDEFFREFFGPAAPEMRAFFDAAEAVWMNQPGRGWWLRFWKSPWQATLWNETELEELEGHLDRAMAACRIRPGAAREDGLSPTRFAERVGRTSELFGLTRIFVRYESLSWELQTMPLEQAGRELAGSALALAREALQARKILIARTAEVVGGNPLAARASDLEWIFLYDTLGSSIAAIGRRLKELGDAEGQQEARALMAEWIRLEDGSALPDFTRNENILWDTDFSLVEDPRYWLWHSLDAEGMEMSVPGGDAGFRAEGVRRGNIFQLFQARPGRFYLGKLLLEADLPDSAEAYIRLDFFSGEHELLGETRRARMAPTGKHGTRQILRALGKAPENTAYGRIFIRFYEMDPGVQADLFEVRVLDLGRQPIP
ncbi:MAG: DUF4838 domain-containing protein [Oceanipulchritudo sp.]